MTSGRIPLATLSDVAEGEAAVAAEKARALAAEAEAVKLTGNQTVAGTKTFSSSPVVPNTPASSGSAISQQYLQQFLEGITPLANVTYATVAALPANTYASGVLTGVAVGALTVDGEAVKVGDKVLVKNEAVKANNGPYVVTHAGGVAEAYVLTRRSDLAHGAEAKSGMLTWVTAGKTEAKDGFWIVGVGPFTVGTSALEWEEYVGGVTEAEVEAALPSSVVSSSTALARTTPVANGSGTYGYRNTDFVSVLDFGPNGPGNPKYDLIGGGTASVGDGSTRKLENVFATLAAARAVYPFATALSNLVDRCALQLAVNTCSAEGGGCIWGARTTLVIGDAPIAWASHVYIMGVSDARTATQGTNVGTVLTTAEADVLKRQIGTLGSPLNTAAAITSIPLTAALTSAVGVGLPVQVVTEGHKQTFVCSATASVGATSITVRSAIPIFAFTSGSVVNIGQAMLDFSGCVQAGAVRISLDCVGSAGTNIALGISDLTGAGASLSGLSTVEGCYFNNFGGSATIGLYGNVNYIDRNAGDNMVGHFIWELNSGISNGVGSDSFISRNHTGFTYGNGQYPYAKLSSELSTGAPITSIAITALEHLPSGSLPAGTIIILKSGTTTQKWTLTANAETGATSLSVASQIPNFAYPTTTTVTVGAAGDGIRLETAGTVVVANQCYNCANGINITNFSQNIRVLGNRCEKNDFAGIVISGNSSVTTVNGNILWDNGYCSGGFGISLFEGALLNNIVGNAIFNVTAPSEGTTGKPTSTGISLSGNAARNQLSSNLIFSTGNNAGISLNSASYNQLNSNFIDTVGGYGILVANASANNRISSSYIYNAGQEGSAFDGINISGGNDNVVDGAMIFNPATNKIRYGMFVATGVTGTQAYNGYCIGGNYSTGSFFDTDSFSSTMVHNWRGFITQKSGTGTIASGTSVTISHGLGFAPTAANFNIVATNATGAMGLYVTSITSSQFTVNGTNGATFGWNAQLIAAGIS